MDTRTEELAAIILERAEEFIKVCRNSSGPYDDRTMEKYKAYRLIGLAAEDILARLEEYRQKFIEDYK